VERSPNSICRQGIDVCAALQHQHPHCHAQPPNRVRAKGEQEAAGSGAARGAVETVRALHARWLRRRDGAGEHATADF